MAAPARRRCRRPAQHDAGGRVAAGGERRVEGEQRGLVRDAEDEVEVGLGVGEGVDDAVATAARAPFRNAPARAPAGIRAAARECCWAADSGVGLVSLSRSSAKAVEVGRAVGQLVFARGAGAGRHDTSDCAEAAPSPPPRAAGGEDEQVTNDQAAVKGGCRIIPCDIGGGRVGSALPATSYTAACDGLPGMVVVITGASSGIGAGWQSTGAARGTSSCWRHGLDRLEELNRAPRRRPPLRPADVSGREDCELLVGAAIERFGRIDTLVCNAGYGVLRRVHETTPQQMQEIFQTNVFGTADCVRPAVPHMLRQEPLPVARAGGDRCRPRGPAGAARSSAPIPRRRPRSCRWPRRCASSCAAADRGHQRPPDRHRHRVREARRMPAPPAAASRPSPAKMRQSAAAVARKIVRAIERPVPELWPFAPSRWLLSLATLAPVVGGPVAGERASWWMIGGKSVSVSRLGASGCRPIPA